MTNERLMESIKQLNQGGTVDQPEQPTLRDQFAMAALGGYFANPHTPHQNATYCASYIWEMADAMLEARK